MNNPYIDAILEIKQLIKTDHDAMVSVDLTSLVPAIEFVKDHLKFIDQKLNELTSKENTHGTE